MNAELERKTLDQLIETQTMFESAQELVNDALAAAAPIIIEAGMLFYKGYVFTSDKIQPNRITMRKCKSLAALATPLDRPLLP